MIARIAMPLPTIPLGMALWVKKERDPANWNPERLAELYGQALPDLEELHEVYLESWRVKGWPG